MALLNFSNLMHIDRGGHDKTFINSPFNADTIVWRNIDTVPSIITHTYLNFPRGIAKNKFVIINLANQSSL